MLVRLFKNAGTGGTLSHEAANAPPRTCWILQDPRLLASGSKYFFALFGEICGKIHGTIGALVGHGLKHAGTLQGLKIKAV